MRRRAWRRAMSHRRRVAVITGIRSEYDLLYSSLRAIQEHEALELSLIVTGAHLSSEYGLTVREIEADGFEITERIDSLFASDGAGARARTLGVEIMSLSQTLARLQPAWMIAAFDREEAIAAALAATYMRVPIAHLGGGDRTESGIVDEQVRCATTKLAHLHLVMTPEHAARVERMGEDAWRIQVVGHGGLDRLSETGSMARGELAVRPGLALTAAPYVVVIHHSLTGEEVQAGEHMRVILEAVADAGLGAVIIYPNSDPGSAGIIEAIKTACDGRNDRAAFANLPRLEFVNLLRHAEAIVGNSSCGIIEAPTLGLPAINVGRRQVGRLHGENVTFVPSERGAIVAAIRRAATDGDYRSRLRAQPNPYGNGTTGRRVAALLADTPIDNRLLAKVNTF
jgi:UDP-hydrolysing UDP-N-acetyl-D-glucosamine 2-epimerase